MKRSSKKSGPRTWRASIIRGKRLEFLGFIFKVGDRATAEDAAVQQFGLNDEQRRRLVV